MIKDISTILFSGDKRVVFRIVDTILWISFVFVTFDKWICSLEVISLKEIDEIFLHLLSASYINFIEWTIIIIFVYYLTKLLLITILPKSKVIFKFYQQSINESIKIPLEDLIYKGKRARESHKVKARLYKSKINTKQNLKIIESSKLLLDILLKIIIIGLIKIQDAQSISLGVSIFSIILSFIGVIVIELVIINKKGQNKTFTLISSLT